MTAETPPPDLVAGCDTPDGVLVLADWIDEHGGDGDDLRRPAAPLADWPEEDSGGGPGYGDPVPHGPPRPGPVPGDGWGNYWVDGPTRVTRSGDGAGGARLPAELPLDHGVVAVAAAHALGGVELVVPLELDAGDPLDHVHQLVDGDQLAAAEVDRLGDVAVGDVEGPDP